MSRKSWRLPAPLPAVSPVRRVCELFTWPSDLGPLASGRTQKVWPLRPEVRGPRSSFSQARSRVRLALLLGMVATVVHPGINGLARAQVSPGPLARAHAAFDGSLACLQCHVTGGEGMDRKCLACHKEIAATLEDKRGLHGRQKRVACARCHPDHAGADFELIQWEEGTAERFDHSRAGFPLAGKHARLACRDCHKAEFQVSPALKLSPRADRSRSWIGLEPTCASCHTDPHQKALGSACESCHGVDGWKPAARFKHESSAYPLTGKHATVACDACHRASRLALPLDAAGKRLALWKPLAHGECSDCHADPHRGQLGAGCAKCHVTDDFARIDRDRFDHDTTRYALRGRHRSVACARCHDAKTAWGPRPRFDTCGACHRDAHAGTARLEGKAVDCAACHGTEGFKPSTYTAAMHATAAYPLVGKHAAVPCARCHEKVDGAAAAELGSARVRLRPKSGACADCHKDAHAGQLANRPDRGACESCHAPTGWKPSRFGLADHERTRFALVGRHATIACVACHGAERRGLAPLPPATTGAGKVLLTLGSLACADCHRDPHRGRFGPKGDRPRRVGCEGCHGQNVFRPAAFDIDEHAQSRYPLEGAHRAVPCSLCHRSLGEGRPGASLRLDPERVPPLEFREKFASCQDCHETPHGDQFTGATDRRDCSACHGMDGFRPATRFDHARLAAFPLTGAHAGVPCAKCHAQRSGHGGAAEVIYRPLPHQCQDCHGSNVSGVAEKGNQP